VPLLARLFPGLALWAERRSVLTLSGLWWG
jgi:hypothetical protein